MISFEKYKKELLDAKLIIGEKLPNIRVHTSVKADIKTDKDYIKDWIVQFAIVKIFSVLETMLRDIVKKEIEMLSNKKYIKISFIENDKSKIPDEIIDFFKKSS